MENHQKIIICTARWKFAPGLLHQRQQPEMKARTSVSDSPEMIEQSRCGEDRVDCALVAIDPQAARERRRDRLEEHGVVAEDVAGRRVLGFRPPA